MDVLNLPFVQNEFPGEPVLSDPKPSPLSLSVATCRSESTRLCTCTVLSYNVVQSMITLGVITFVAKSCIRPLKTAFHN